MKIFRKENEIDGNESLRNSRKYFSHQVSFFLCPGIHGRLRPGVSYFFPVLGVVVVRRTKFGIAIFRVGEILDWFLN